MNINKEPKFKFKFFILIICALTFISNTSYSVYSNNIGNVKSLENENEISASIPPITEEMEINAENNEIIEVEDNNEDTEIVIEDESELIIEDLEEVTTNPPVEEINSADLNPTLATINTFFLEDGISSIVYNFQQLKEVVEQDNNITNIHLGADISNFDTKVYVSNKKESLTIYGASLDSEVLYTITSTNKNNAGIVIAAANNVTKRITLSDINITNMGGALGFIQVDEIVSKSIIANIHNTSFTGKYFIFNPRGEVLFTGKNRIVIPGLYDLHAVLTNDITIDGELFIESNSIYATINFVDYPNSNKGRYSFTVLENANVHIEAPKATQGVFYTNDLNHAPDVLLKPYSNMTVLSKDDLFYQSGNSLYVSENAKFHFSKTGGITLGDKAAIRLKKSLYIGKNSTFFLKQTAGSFLIKFYSVRAGEKGNLTIDSPKSAIFWNEANTELLFGHTYDDFISNTTRVKYWSKSDNVDSEPLYDWDAPSFDVDNINVSFTKYENSVSLFTSNIADLTENKFNLGKVAKKVEFTSDSGLPIWSVITYDAKYENSSSSVPNFNMEDKTVYSNNEISVTPPNIDNSTPIYFTLNGEKYDFDANVKAIFTPVEGNTEIVFIYTIDLVINVSIPIKMMFKTFEESGNVYVDSPTYSITNHSTYPVEIIVASLYENEVNDVTLVPANVDNLPINALHLYLNPLNIGGDFNNVDLLSSLSDEKMGTLRGSEATTMNKVSFTINGTFYEENPLVAKKPIYKVEFKFKVKLSDT